MVVPQQKATLFLILLTFLTFGNSLFNGFTGDDHLILLQNDFYKSWRNFPKLFTPAYITNPDDIFNEGNPSLGSGEVSYRVVKSITHFFDYGIWRMNPFGHHLTNLLIHTGNVLLVYFVVFHILQQPVLSFLSAILFSVHPLQTESVCAVNYRHGMIANLFLLSAFLCYTKCLTYDSAKRHHLFCLSHIFYFLSLFSKESAIVFPGLIMAYDILIKGDRWQNCVREIPRRYGGFIVISLLCVYLHTRIFPSSVLGHVDPMAKDAGEYILGMIRILVHYLAGFVFPFGVGVMPPFYMPPKDIFWPYEAAGVFLTAIVFLWLLWRIVRRDTKLTFFCLWFLSTYIPIANIIPILNPMAWRFMYTPLMGLSVISVVVFDQLFLPSLQVRLKRGLFIFILILCGLHTFSLNMLWRSDHTLAFSMLQYYPRHPHSHLFVGMAYFDRGQFAQAEKFLKSSLILGVRDPRAYQYLGVVKLHDFEAMKPYYEEGIQRFPNFAFSYRGLGRIYVLENHPQKALGYLRRSVELVPTYSAYAYLIQAYLLLNQVDAAQGAFDEVSLTITDKAHLHSLKKFFEEGEKAKLPLDIGI